MTMSEALITEKAELIEKYAKNLANKVNAELEEAKIISIALTVLPPYQFDGETHFKGFVSVYIRFDREEPAFLTQEDKKLWQSEKEKILYRVFKFDYINYMAIWFSENTYQDLY